jgi:hypothetical protein
MPNPRDVGEELIVCFQKPSVVKVMSFNPGEGNSELVLLCRFSVKWKEAFSVSVNSALRAGIFKAFGSFDPMWF